ncbi:hypothetical protein BRI6_2127 [plant metagenome]|uniref:WbqC-like protein family n=1 Tax=plant metagenome TaxID=1297885 RepID=A0A484XEE7_9ZZZZ
MGTQGCVVISQPMYFPWVGMLEQIRLCDTFVYYDDVQFSRGGFFNRVQIKTAHGIRWLTVPLQGLKLGQRINEVQIDNKKDWRRSHRDQLAQAYENAPFKAEMLSLVDAVFAQDHDIIGDVAQASMNALVDYFAPIGAGKPFLVSSRMEVAGASSERVIDVCAALHAKRYLTGHGARRYLDHEGFEQRSMSVDYIDYGLQPYPQDHGAFTPYVSALDLIAQCGREGLSHIKGTQVPWRTFLARHRPPEQGES